jgi:hypothetical protein
VTGSQAMYDTLANYQTGARILEQPLTIRSLSHEENLYNYDLVLFPMQTLSFRVDYKRNRIIGPALRPPRETCSLPSEIPELR